MNTSGLKAIWIQSWPFLTLVVHEPDFHFIFFYIIHQYPSIKRENSCFFCNPSDQSCPVSGYYFEKKKIRSPVVRCVLFMCVSEDMAESSILVMWLLRIWAERNYWVAYERNSLFLLLSTLPTCFWSLTKILIAVGLRSPVWYWIVSPYTICSQ